MNFRCGTNTVLVRFDEDFTASNSGLVVRDFVDGHLTKSPWGTVVSAPMSLFFHDSKYGLKSDDYRDQYYSQVSMPWKVPCEVYKGDRVICSYLANLDYRYLVGEGIYAVPYEMIYGVKSFDKIYPINGYVLLEVDKIERTVSGIKIQGQRNHDSTGKVIAEGYMVEKYIEGGHDSPSHLVGRDVIFRRATASRIEYDLYQKQDKLLYRVHRKHIFAHEGL